MAAALRGYFGGGKRSWYVLITLTNAFGFTEMSPVNGCSSAPTIRIE